MGGLRLPASLAKRIVRRALPGLKVNRTSSTSSDVPKGFLAVYVGEAEKKRFVVPISYLSQHSFQNLLRVAEEEFGFSHPMGGLTIPCREDTFMDVTSNFNRS